MLRPSSFFLPILVLLSGCPSTPTPPNLEDELPNEWTVHVSFGKPVVGASVAVHVNDPTAEPLVSGQTDEHGIVELSFFLRNGPAWLCASGGVFVDILTEVPTLLGDQRVCAFVPDLSRQEYAVTPLSHLTWVLTDAIARLDAQDLQTAHQQARAWMLAFLNCSGRAGDIINAIPKDPTVESGALDQEMMAAILLAGLSGQSSLISTKLGLTPGIRFTTISLLDGLSSDLVDARLDGAAGLSPVVVEGYHFTAETMRSSPEGFVQGVRYFIEHERNVTGVRLDDVRDLLDCWATHAGELFGSGSTGELDVDGPEVSVVAPTTGATISSDTQLWLIAVDPSEIVRFEVTDGADHVSDETPTLKGATADLKGTILIAGLDEGSASLTVEAEDSVGNVSTAVVAFSVDKSAPIIVISEPEKDATVRGSTVAIDATATDGQGVEVIELVYPPITADVSGNALTASWNTLVEPDGDYVIRVRAEDTQGHESTLDWPVVIDNYGPGSIGGTVSMETPVADAVIDVLEFAGGVRGALLGTAVADSGGKFTVSISDTWDGPVLIRAHGTGAAYTDAATGAVIAFENDSELLAVLYYTRPILPDTNEITGLSVHAATTLAAKLAGVMMAGGADPLQAIEDANVLIGSHIERTVRPDGIPIRWTPVANWLAQPSTAEEQRLLGLFHVGLARWGAEACTRYGQPAFCRPGIRTLRFLMTDLASGCLNGEDSGGQDIWVLSPNRVKLSVNTLRSDLAGTTSRWLDNIILPDGTTGNPNQTGIGSSSFAESGNFFDALSTDDSTLFCEIPGAPFDTEPPDISAHFIDASSAPIDHLTQRLKGTVTLVVTATDTSGFVLEPLTISPADVFDAAYWISAPPDSPITAEFGFDTTGFADGEHTITITADDSLGVQGQTELAFVVDNGVPTLETTITEFTNNPLVSFSWTVSDTVGPIDRLEVRAEDPAGIMQLVQVIDSPAVTGGIDFDLGYCDAEVTCTVTAYDSAGWSTTTYGEVLCDDTPPILGYRESTYKPENDFGLTATHPGVITYHDDVNPTNIAVTGITLHKYRHFFYGGADNMPTFKIGVEDLGGVGTSPTDMFVQYKYERVEDGAPLLQRDWTTLPRVVDGYELELSPENLSMDILYSLDEHIITFAATDLVGNTNTLEWHFFLDLIPTPVAVTGCGLPAEATQENIRQRTVGSVNPRPTASWNVYWPVGDMPYGDLPDLTVTRTAAPYHNEITAWGTAYRRYLNASYCKLVPEYGFSYCWAGSCPVDTTTRPFSYDGAYPQDNYTVSPNGAAGIDVGASWYVLGYGDPFSWDVIDAKYSDLRKTSFELTERTCAGGNCTVCGRDYQDRRPVSAYKTETEVPSFSVSEDPSFPGLGRPVQVVYADECTWNGYRYVTTTATESITSF